VPRVDGPRFAFRMQDSPENCEFRGPWPNLARNLLARRVEANRVQPGALLKDKSE
jgi:hypothetical protein